MRKLLKQWSCVIFYTLVFHCYLGCDTVRLNILRTFLRTFIGENGMPSIFVDDFLPKLNTLVNIDFFVSYYPIYNVLQCRIIRKWRKRFQHLVNLDCSVAVVSVDSCFHTKIWWSLFLQTTLRFCFNMISCQE